ncbi:hypothetical protein [Streptomyces yunnanensis]|uniref:hypothetical protein n=1 Tax=Streptomyces yunnanensis TaxID=156453 RepID=UPI00116119DB|nr:hypothetical protein [Streptomyces yunnanensis]
MSDRVLGQPNTKDVVVDAREWIRGVRREDGIRRAQTSLFTAEFSAQWDAEISLCHTVRQRGVGNPPIAGKAPSVLEDDERGGRGRQNETFCVSPAGPLGALSCCLETTSWLLFITQGPGRRRVEGTVLGHEVREAAIGLG